MTKKIYLSKGLYALVDDEDYEWLNQWKWYCDSKGYAVRNIPTDNGKRIKELMHRVIINASSNMFVDHKDSIRLNNQKHNLRECTNRDNLMNRGKNKNNTTGYKGVIWNKQRNKYQAHVCHNRKLIYGGLFENPEDAARAYDKLSLKIFGNFAKLNFEDSNAP